MIQNEDIPLARMTHTWTVTILKDKEKNNTNEMDIYGEYLLSIQLSLVWALDVTTKQPSWLRSRLWVSNGDGLASNLCLSEAQTLPCAVLSGVTCVCVNRAVRTLALTTKHKGLSKGERETCAVA